MYLLGKTKKSDLLRPHVENETTEITAALCTGPHTLTNITKLGLVHHKAAKFVINEEESNHCNDLIKRIVRLYLLADRDSLRIQIHVYLTRFSVVISPVFIITHAICIPIGTFPCDGFVCIWQTGRSAVTSLCSVITM